MFAGILVGLGVWIDRANSCDVEASGMLGLLLLLVVLMLLMRPYFDKVPTPSLVRDVALLVHVAAWAGRLLWHASY